jgi:transposase
MARKGRRSSHEERIRAMQLLAQGHTKPEVARILGVAESSVYAWQKDYREGGLGALSTKTASGRKPLLSDEQLIELFRMLRRGPRPLDLDFGLWTRSRVRDLISQEFGTGYSQQNVGRILKLLGFSPRRSAYQAVEQGAGQRRKWMEAEFPAIRKRAAEAGAQIFFADEAECRNDHRSGTTRAPAGETPVVKFTGNRESAVMISAVSLRGAMHWRIYEGPVNSARFLDFLGDLIADVNGKIFLVVDNVTYHKSAATREWVKRHENRVELFYLPGSSPDLSPDELVWKNVKNDNAARTPHILSRVRLNPPVL